MNTQNRDNILKDQDHNNILCNRFLRRHFQHVLLHNFPEQYNRVLHLLLKSSEAQSCSPALWCDLINTLGQGFLRFQPESSMEEFRQEVLQYTNQQTLLDVNRVLFSSKIFKRL